MLCCKKLLYFLKICNLYVCVCTPEYIFIFVYFSTHNGYFALPCKKPARVISGLKLPIYFLLCIPELTNPSEAKGKTHFCGFVSSSLHCYWKKCTDKPCITKILIYPLYFSTEFFLSRVFLPRKRKKKSTKIWGLFLNNVIYTNQDVRCILSQSDCLNYYGILELSILI